ncbi:MAG: hypothetical protein IEMM0008_1369 [bacterium]|nr:MAG: hypothetical protein IEMM0008_1369 [bacterium]
MKNEAILNKRQSKARKISIFIFVLGFCALISAESYQDFYFDMKSRYMEESVDYSKLPSFCGWTNGKYPGESEIAYNIRAFWNMLSAMLAMAVLVTLVLGFFMGIIISLFKLSGALK